MKAIVYEQPNKVAVETVPDRTPTCASRPGG